MNNPEIKPNNHAVGCYLFFVGITVWLNIFQYAGVINWHWSWLVAPLWIPFALVAIIYTGAFIYANYGNS